jgi:2-iminobutanoate/2-iminopropanoate deaminase
MKTESLQGGRTDLKCVLTEAGRCQTCASPSARLRRLANVTQQGVRCRPCCLVTRRSCACSECNAQQVRQGISQRGGAQRQGPRTTGLICADALAENIVNLVFVASQTGRHPSTRGVSRGVREQTRNALERIKLILEAAGTSVENVLTVTTYLTIRENPAAYNEEYAKYFPTNKPAGTAVEVMLNSPELLVEITVTAGIPE